MDDSNGKVLSDIVPNSIRLDTFFTVSIYQFHIRETRTFQPVKRSSIPEFELPTKVKLDEGALDRLKALGYIQ